MRYDKPNGKNAIEMISSSCKRGVDDWEESQLCLRRY